MSTGRKAALLALLAAATLLPLSLFYPPAVEADQQLSLDIWEAHGRDADSVCRVLTELGSIYLWGIVLLVLVAAGRRELALYLLVAMTLQFFLGAGLKLLIDRPRPFEELAIITSYRPTSPSFPSGHTLAAVTAAATVAMRHRRAAVPMAALASVVGASRILLGVHYPLDVIAAVAIGLLVAMAVGSLDLRPILERVSMVRERLGHRWE